MAEKEVPFWEEAYQNPDHITFSNEPNGTIKEFEKLLPKGARILEAGCGEGENVLHAFVDDLTTYRFDKIYDLIMSFGTLHFVKKDLWKQFIRRAKEICMLPTKLWQEESNEQKV